MIRTWVTAFRLRTLPLALASVLMGGILAAAEGFRDDAVFLMCCLTTCFLQILSNLANDYGDAIHGADNAVRVGPRRAVESGLISATAMKTAVALTAFLAFISGAATLLLAFRDQWLSIMIWLVIGLACIGAAITYTAGRKPYGYLGLGDVSVVLFFGLVAVCGTVFVISGEFFTAHLLPALSCGMLAAGVLNINNVRDMQSDLAAGKYSIPVRIGRKAASVYHSVLLYGAVLLSLLFITLRPDARFQDFLFLLSLPFLYRIDSAVRHLPNAQLDPWLKRMSLTTLLFVVLFGLGLLPPWHF